MATENETVVRAAFEALARGDAEAMLEMVDPELEWTFLDPSQVDPEPQVCRGRDQLRRWAKLGGNPNAPLTLEQVVDQGDRLVVVTHAAGLDARRARQTGDRNFHLVTVKAGKIVTLRACRDRAEAERLAPGVNLAPDPAPAGPSTDESMVLLAGAIRTGDVASVERLIGQHPVLVNSRLGGDNGRTPLSVATDWPGFFPNAPEIVRILMAAGADPDLQPETGEPGETPLHWAASSGDVEVAAALIAGGADIEAPHGSIGTPIENAIGYGCFGVARLLLASGARVGNLWVAAALGLRDRLTELLAERDYQQDEIDQAFWHACSGGQRRAAEFLHGLGADVNAHPEYAHDLPLDAVGGVDTEHSAVVEWLKSVGARSGQTDD